MIPLGHSLSTPGQAAGTVGSGKAPKRAGIKQGKPQGGLVGASPHLLSIQTQDLNASIRSNGPIPGHAGLQGSALSQTQVRQQQQSPGAPVQPPSVPTPLSQFGLFNLALTPPLSGDQSGYTLEYWQKFVQTFFDSEARLKYRLVSSVSPVDSRTFVAPYAILPRFFYLHFQSGCTSLQYQLLNPSEFYANIIDVPRACISQTFENKSKVLAEGQLRITYSLPELKIVLLEFKARSFEEYFPSSTVFSLMNQETSSTTGSVSNSNSKKGKKGDERGGTKKGSKKDSAASHSTATNVPVMDMMTNEYGLPLRVMRCLEMAEVCYSMTELIEASKRYQMGPQDLLSSQSFPEEWKPFLELPNILNLPDAVKIPSQKQQQQQERDRQMIQELHKLQQQQQMQLQEQQKMIQQTQMQIDQQHLQAQYQNLSPQGHLQQITMPMSNGIPVTTLSSSTLMNVPATHALSLAPALSHMYAMGTSGIGYLQLGNAGQPQQILHAQPMASQIVSPQQYQQHLQQTQLGQQGQNY